MGKNGGLKWSHILFEWLIKVTYSTISIWKYQAYDGNDMISKDNKLNEWLSNSRPKKDGQTKTKVDDENEELSFLKVEFGWKKHETRKKLTNGD